MFREFKPTQLPRTDASREEVEALFAKGAFKRAYRYCREYGWPIDEFSEAIAKMARLMFHSRPGELVSLVTKYEIDVGYPLTSILKALLVRRDYHGFLKHVHNLGMHEEFESEVNEAVSQLKREEEAQSWRMKFGIGQ